MIDLRKPLICLWLAAVSARADFPEPYDSEPDKQATPPAAAAAVRLLDLPAGFTATVYASEPEVRNPIAMAWDHRGRMWVAENFTYAERSKRFELELRDRILIFHDRDGDGRAESRKVFSDDLQMLTSVEVGEGGIWAMCPPQLLFIPDADGDDVPDGEPVVKLDGFTVAKNNYHNFANGLRWGPDGWLYGRCGHSCPGKPGKPGTPEAERVPMEGGIFRYHPQREVVEVIAHGTTNPWGHDWDRHGELFFINTVNGHLWHGIPGAHFREHFGSSPNPHVYERLEMHADHWHFDTGQHWTKSRGGAANDFGGGHAHIGMMIYQAEQWPEPMRDRLYTLNMHGLRTNVERLERHGSGYVGRHEDDVFVTADQWFRGIDIRQGPEGSAYVLDWSDTGECHEHSGVHRSSGRIYRISNGTPDKPALGDLQEITPEGIRRMIAHPNVWFERQLRRRLAAGAGEGHRALLEGMLGEGDTVSRLRSLWALNEIGGATPELLVGLLEVEDEHLRAWAVRLLLDGQPIDTILGPLHPKGRFPHEARLAQLAADDPSGLVKLTIASGLQRLHPDQRVMIALALAGDAAYADDHNLPTITWYGMIPIGDSNPMALVAIAGSTRWELLHRWTARFLAGRVDEEIAAFDALLELAAKSDTAFQSAVLDGIRDALEGRKSAPQPPAWPRFIAAADDPSLLRRVRSLSLVFGNQEVIGSIKRIARDESAPLGERRSALQSLIENEPADLRELCESLLAQQGINATAARGLTRFDDPAIGKTLVSHYGDFAAADRIVLVEALVSRPAWAGALLDRIGAGEISRGDLAAFHARQIRAFGDKDLSAQLEEVWGDLRESSADKRELIESWKQKLTPEKLSGADLGKGRLVYAASCGACHKMYGEGGMIGPDLTGSGRKDLGYLLENIADPGAVVSADYRMSVIELKDGRVVTGVIEKEDKKTLTLRQIAGQLIVAKGDIKSRSRPAISMMPDGLLTVLDETQVRNLIAYLQHPEQVPLPDDE